MHQILPEDQWLPDGVDKIQYVSYDIETGEEFVWKEIPIVDDKEDMYVDPNK